MRKRAPAMLWSRRTGTDRYSVDVIGKSQVTRPALNWHSAGRACLCALAATATTTGCSSTGSDLLKAPAGLVTAGAEAVANVQLPKADTDPVGSPIEIYTRIGRGAGICWFGPHGELKATHIFHAEVAPPSKGGRSEIVIHEKDLSMPNPRGNRAFRVHISPHGDNAELEIENIRFPIETGQRMAADIRRWARDDLTCHDAAHTKGWDAKNAPPQPDAPAKPAPKARERKT